MTLLPTVMIFIKAVALRDELIAFLLSGGFELRKFSNNHEKVLRDLPSVSQAPIKFDGQESNFVKVLGLQWNPPVKLSRMHFIPSTKRAVLSGIA